MLMLLLSSSAGVHHYLVVGLFDKFPPNVLPLDASVLWPGAMLWPVLLLWLSP